jgi:hypothetical protein
MSALQLGLLIAIAFALVEQVNARGRSLLAWSAIIGFAVLFWFG